jgi:hypothetical protein
VLFALEEGDPSDEDTFSDLDMSVLAATEAPPAAATATDGAARAPLRAPVPPPRRERRASKAFLLVALILLAFAGIAALALFGLSRSHFVGADEEGRVAVYQGVPWDVAGGIDLYREVYVSRLLAAQLARGASGALRPLADQRVRGEGTYRRVRTPASAMSLRNRELLQLLAVGILTSGFASVYVAREAVISTYSLISRSSWAFPSRTLWCA